MRETFLLFSCKWLHLQMKNKRKEKEHVLSFAPRAGRFDDTILLFHPLLKSVSDQYSCSLTTILNMLCYTQEHKTVWGKFQIVVNWRLYSSLSISSRHFYFKIKNAASSDFDFNCVKDISRKILCSQVWLIWHGW